MAPMYLFAAYIDPIFTGGRAVEDPEPKGGHFLRNGYHILKPNTSLMWAKGEDERVPDNDEEEQGPEGSVNH